jgi:hypothetical protein
MKSGKFDVAKSQLNTIDNNIQEYFQSVKSRAAIKTMNQSTPCPPEIIRASIGVSRSNNFSNMTDLKQPVKTRNNFMSNT